MWQSSVGTGTLLQQVKNGVPVLGNFSKTADRNETTPISKQSLAQAGFNKKKFHQNRITLQRVIAKYRYRTKWPKKQSTLAAEPKLLTELCRYRYPASAGQKWGTCLGQFLENGWSKRNDTYIKTKLSSSWV